MSFRLLLAGLALAASPLAAAPFASAQAQNWNIEYAQTGKGHRVGNPEAPAQLIEFVSYTCPHCADYAHQSDAPLRAGYIHEGRAAVEVRFVIRNIVDLAATLVTQCGADDQFFANHRAMLLSHETWMARANSATSAQTARWGSGNIASRMRAIAGDLDFYELMEPRGYSIAELDQCLSDEDQARQIAEQAVANSAEFDVPGTPSFVLNGTLLEGVHSWPALKLALDEVTQ